MNEAGDSHGPRKEEFVSELNTVDYYRRRERQERVLAEGAQVRGIQKIHLHMAEHYASLVARAESGVPQHSLKLVASGL
jgi:hypothetical protein